jgi:polyphosphate glucokinase
VINDAAMQALGSYQGGKMLFLGLGTGVGAAVIVDGELEPLAIGVADNQGGQRVGRSLEGQLAPLT